MNMRMNLVNIRQESLVYRYYNKKMQMYIKSNFEISIFFKVFFNKYKITFIKRSLHHLVGNLNFYNFFIYLYAITCVVNIFSPGMVIEICDLENYLVEKGSRGSRAKLIWCWAVTLKT